MVYPGPWCELPYTYFFHECNLSRIAMKCTQEKFCGFLFSWPGSRWSNWYLFYLVHILHSCMYQHECFLMVFWIQEMTVCRIQVAKQCRGQIFVSINFRGMGFIHSFGDITKFKRQKHYKQVKALYTLVHYEKYCTRAWA